MEENGKDTFKELVSPLHEKTIPAGYKNFLESIKLRIRSSQVKAAIKLMKNS